jgi:hypothetical protein
MNKFLPVLLFSLTFLIGGEISVSISEDLVNEYLNLIGNYQIVTGKKDNQATWTINNPRVKFQYGKAVFLTTILFEKGKTDIKKDIKRNIDVKYNSNKNTLKLVITDSLIKMERRGNVLGKIDLGSIYQSGLIFPGPKPSIDSFKLKTKEGRVKIHISTRNSHIYFEKDVIRLALDLEYE